MTKVILTCAMTGGHVISPRYPAQLVYPVSPEQMAADVVRVANAGAAVVHIHARDPVTRQQTRDLAVYQEICERIRSCGVDIVINLTCGHAAYFLPDPDDESHAAPGSDVASVDDRVRHVEVCRPEMCSLDVTTANQVDSGVEFVYLNTPRTLRAMARRLKDAGVKPEIEVFTAGDIVLANQLYDEGLFEEPPLYQFVLGIKWGAPATAASMIYMRDLLPNRRQWAGFGVGALQMPMLAQAVLLGGHARVGLEDNIYLRKGEFATNAQLVERAVALIRLLGGEVATPQEVRSMLKLRCRESAHATTTAGGTT